MLFREIEKGRRGRIRKQLLDELKGKIGLWILKEEALDRTVWNTGFGRGCSVLWMVECDTVLLSGRWMDIADRHVDSGRWVDIADGQVDSSQFDGYGRPTRGS
jgi:hypothetical protein